MFHRSNQNNTAPNPSAPELNTWNWSEVKTSSQCGTGVECRTRNPEVPGSNPDVAKMKISHRSNQNNTTTNPSAPDLLYLKLSEVKTRSHHGTVVEWRTRDPEVPGSNPDVAKKKISHRSNQNNTTTNHSIPDLNTWNCQRWKPEVAVAQWQSAGLEIQRSPVQTLVWPKRKSLTGPIRTIPPPTTLYQT